MIKYCIFVVGINDRFLIFFKNIAIMLFLCCLASFFMSIICLLFSPDIIYFICK